MRRLRSLPQGGLLGLGLALLAALWALSAASAGAQTQGTERVQQGARIFQQNCASCHTIGKGDSLGPDLAGVTARRDQAWLRRWIAQPDRMLAEKDPIATELLQKYKNLPMPNLNLTAEQVEALLAYMGAGQPTEAAIPDLYLPTLGAGVVAIIALTLLALSAATKRVEVRP